MSRARGKAVVEPPPHSEESEPETPLVRKRRRQRQPPPPDFDITRFSSKENQEWYQARESIDFVYELHIAPEVDAAHQITAAFAALGWAPILALPYQIVPDLVREFYANIEDKKGHSGERIETSVRGVRLEITRSTIAQTLGCSDEGPAIDLKKDFSSPDREWDPSHAMARFGVAYEEFRGSQSQTKLARSFPARHRAILYTLAHNVIPKKSGQGELRNSDLYFLDRMFHGQDSPFAQIPLPNIIISHIRTTARRTSTSFHFGFPRLISLLLHRARVIPPAIPPTPLRPVAELSIGLLKDLHIDVSDIARPRREPVQRATRQEGGEAGSSSAAPPPPPPRPGWQAVMDTLGGFQTQMIERWDRMETQFDSRWGHMEEQIGALSTRLGRIEAHFGIQPPEQPIPETTGGDGGAAGDDGSAP